MQSTFHDSTLYTGFRIENRIRLLRREHFINPVLYIEYENISDADKIIKEVEGHDVQADFADPNAILRETHNHELEFKAILSKDDVVTNHDGQQCRRARRQAASVSVESLTDAAKGGCESAKLRRFLLRFHFSPVDAWMQCDARGGIPFDTSFLR